MLYEMRMASESLRKEGLSAVLRRILRYLIKLPRYLIFTIKITFGAKNRDLDLKRLIDFAFEAYGGLIRPLQIRSEILQLLELLQLRTPERILEIGTSNGGTLFLLSRIASANACIISIDLPLGFFGGGYPGWKKFIYRSFASRSQKIHLVRADSHSLTTRGKIKTILQGQSLDLLFIDGDHTYEGAKNDFEMYEPFVRQGGLVVLHDIVRHSTKSGCRVEEYWNELKHRYQYTEFVDNADQHWAGLGIIIKDNATDSNAGMGRESPSDDALHWQDKKSIEHG